MLHFGHIGSRLVPGGATANQSVKTGDLVAPGVAAPPPAIKGFGSTETKTDAPPAVKPQSSHNNTTFSSFISSIFGFSDASVSSKHATAENNSSNTATVSGSPSSKLPPKSDGKKNEAGRKELTEQQKELLRKIKK